MCDTEIAQLKNLFFQLDENGDGQLTVAEITTGLANAGITEGAENLKALLEQIDSDGSGVIDWTEFIAATLDRKQYIKEEACWAAFNVFDRDGNGKISKQEIADVLNNGDLTSIIGKNLVDEILNDTDTDGDGEIDFQEFIEMMRRPEGKVGNLDPDSQEKGSPTALEEELLAWQI